jgi:hypothetical protein
VEVGDLVEPSLGVGKISMILWFSTSAIVVA